MRTLSRLSATILVALLTITVMSVSLASTADAATSGHRSACRSAHFKHAHPKRYHRLCSKRTSVQVSAPTASRPGAFSAPTTITYTGNTCTHPNADYWVVTTRFTVTGGRYAYIGDLNNDGTEHYDDNVSDGGTRTVTRVINIYGWPGPDPSVPTAIDVTARQMIAPIESQRDRSTWVVITHDLTVNVSCS